MKLPAVAPEMLAPTRSVIAGTAGHIDHGKTALVLALTGKDTDRLPEEKSRGISIDIGFASLTLADRHGCATEVSLVDVPGHHAFIRNMLAGTGGIDLLLLVIAADEGVKAQTREHLAICTLLGISRGIVVLTKRDTAPAARLEEVAAEARDLVRGTFLEHAPILSVSARTGEGIGELKSAIATLAEAMPARSTRSVLRLPLDRSFAVKGFGTVVTGTLQSGTLQKGETIEVQPGGRAVRVRGLQVHGRSRDAAHAPSRVAVNLSGVEVADVHRGCTLVRPGTLAPVSIADVELTPIAGATPLRHRSRVHVHAFTEHTSARVLLYGAAQGNAGGPLLARLRFDRPMLLVPGDAFVVRQPSPAATIAGGRVLDAHPLPKLKRAAAEKWIQLLRSADAASQILQRVRRRGVAGVQVAQLGRETGLTELSIVEMLKAHAASGLILCSLDPKTADHWIAMEAVDAAEKTALAALNKAKSISSAELRSQAGLAEWVFHLITGRLGRAGRIRVEADHVSLPNAAAPVDERIARVESIYRAAGLNAPIVSEVREKLRIPDQQMHGIMTQLIRSGTLVRMGADNLFIHADRISELADRLRAHRGEQFDVARFKSFTGLTRKLAIPLLEHLDRTRVTRKTGDVRVVV